jgi:hypothetical protein
MYTNNEQRESWTQYMTIYKRKKNGLLQVLNMSAKIKFNEKEIKDPKKVVTKIQKHLRHFQDTEYLINAKKGTFMRLNKKGNKFQFYTHNHQGKNYLYWVFKQSSVEDIDNVSFVN